MIHDPSPYFYAAAAIGLLLGWFSHAILTARAIHRARIEGYTQASLFYERKNDPTARRI